MSDLEKAGKQKSPGAVAAACDAFEKDPSLSQSLLLANGPLGKACRLLNPWLVEEVRRYTQQPLSKGVLDELFVATLTKPSYVVKETQAIWDQRYQRKKMAILTSFAPDLDEDAALKELTLRNLIGDWFEAVPSFPLEESLLLVLRWLPPDQTLHTTGPERSEDFTALHWAWEGSSPAAAEGLVALGYPLFGSPADKGWSLAGELLACHEQSSELLQREGWKRLLAQTLATRMDQAWEPSNPPAFPRPRM